MVYEALVGDMPALVRELLGMLVIDPSTARAVGPRHHRQADRLNDEWVKRYQDLHQIRDGNGSPSSGDVDR